MGLPDHPYRNREINAELRAFRSASTKAGRGTFSTSNGAFTPRVMSAAFHPMACAPSVSHVCAAMSRHRSGIIPSVSVTY